MPPQPSEADRHEAETGSLQISAAGEDYHVQLEVMLLASTQDGATDLRRIAQLDSDGFITQMRRACSLAIQNVLEDWIIKADKAEDAAQEATDES